MLIFNLYHRQCFNISIVFNTDTKNRKLIYFNKLDLENFLSTVISCIYKHHILISRIESTETKTIRDEEQH